ncbi:MAG: L,D-transpeptidase family protein [Planctomycetaceae bacterium]
MRRGHRNRPIFGLVFWTLVLGGTSLYTAWKFEWLSVEFSDLVATRSTDAGDESDAADELPDRTSEDLKRGVAVDSAEFSDQTEPPEEPVAEVQLERRVADSNASARLRMLQQRQPLDGSNEPPRRLRPETSPQLPLTRFPQSAEPAEAQTAAASEATELPPADNDVRAAVAPASVTPADGSSVIQASNEEPQLPPARPLSQQSQALEPIEKLLQDGDTLGAHRELSKLYWAKPDARAEILPKIEKTAEIIYFSPQPHFLEPYVVQPEDQFAKFAKAYNVPWQYLARLNRVDPTRIRPGQKLKVIRGPFSAVVDLSRFELTVHAHGYFVRRFEVGIGKQGTSPVGKFKVLEKVVNPQYTDPEGRVVDADDPTNPLGERWLDLGDGYGIHGTIDPESIGRAESRGCIRLQKQDVEDDYDLLGVGSEVVIRP